MVASRATDGTSMDTIQRLQRLCEDAGGRTAFESALDARTPVDVATAEPQAAEKIAPQVAQKTSPEELSSWATNTQGLPLVTLFAGKMPWDFVDGFNFATHPKVVTAISKAVGDDKIVKSLLSENVVANPISNPSGSSGVMVYEACEPQNCADNNWRILYYASSGSAEVCLSNRDDPYSFRGWMPSMEKLASEEDCSS